MEISQKGKLAVITVAISLQKVFIIQILRLRSIDLENLSITPHEFGAMQHFLYRGCALVIIQ